MPESPLQELLRNAGAVYAGEAQRPAHYGDTAAEYRQTLAAAGLFDLSDHGQLEVKGPDAPAFLHNLSTNDINHLPLGGGCEAYFCDPRARALAHAFIYHVLVEGKRHAFWLDVTPGFHETLLKHLDRHLIAEQVELIDQTGRFAQMHLAGPQAQEILARTLGDAVPELPEFAHMERTFGLNAVCHIRRRDPLGVPGYDLVCLNERAEAVWKLLASAGACPAGQEAFEILRIEAGTPVYGIDIDANRFVMEAARALRAVSYAKGCYLGQEPIVMARDRAGHVNRAFLGVKALEAGRITPGAKLTRDGADVGIITSATHSPRLNAGLGIGYIRRGHQDPGTRLQAQTTEGSWAVEVLAFPPVAFQTNPAS